MAENEGYGYVNPDEEISTGGGSALVFGLNPEITMSKFEWIANGGKDGAEQEALDVVFVINGKDTSARKFPITKAFGENNVEIVDPASEEMKAARKQLNAWLTSLMHCFVSDEDLKVALSVPMQSFKQYCTILMGLLPKNYTDLKLDLFAQYQWQIKGEANKTYLQIPDKMKYGKWITRSIPAVNADGSKGTWNMNRVVNPADGLSAALYYTDGMGNVHLFTRNGWFVNSNFANQQKEGGGSDTGNASMAPSTATGTAAPAATAKGW